MSVALIQSCPPPARARQPIPAIASADAEPLSGWDDMALAQAVRTGDMNAAGVLYARHFPFAVRAAGAIGNPGIAEDLASDALTKVVSALLNGRGPDTAVRAYLVRTIRNLFADRLRKLNAEILVDPTTSTMDQAEDDPTELALERSVVIEVLAQLPERWREVLWRTIVLEEPLAEVGASMGLNANAAAALSYRARRALTKAYLHAVPAAA